MEDEVDTRLNVDDMDDLFNLPAPLPDIDDGAADGLNLSFLNEAEGDEGDDDKKPEKRKKAVRRRKRLLLNEEKLLNTERGLHAVKNVFADVKFKGKGHEASDLKVLLHHYEHWAHRLFPKYPFEAFVERVEVLGTKRPVKISMARLRQGLDDDYEPARGNSDEEDTVEGGDRGSSEEDRENIQTPNNAGFGVDVQSEPPPQPAPVMTAEQLERMRRNREMALAKREAAMRARLQQQHTQEEESMQINTHKSPDQEKKDSNNTVDNGKKISQKLTGSITKNYDMMEDDVDEFQNMGKVDKNGVSKDDSSVKDILDDEMVEVSHTNDQAYGLEYDMMNIHSNDGKQQRDYSVTVGRMSEIVDSRKMNDGDENAKGYSFEQETHKISQAGQNKDTSENEKSMTDETEEPCGKMDGMGEETHNMEQETLEYGFEQETIKNSQAGQNKDTSENEKGMTDETEEPCSKMNGVDEETQDYNMEQETLEYSFEQETHKISQAGQNKDTSENEKGMTDETEEPCGKMNGVGEETQDYNMEQETLEYKCVDKINIHKNKQSDLDSQTEKTENGVTLEDVATVGDDTLDSNITEETVENTTDQDTLKYNEK